MQESDNKHFNPTDVKRAELNWLARESEMLRHQIEQVLFRQSTEGNRRSGDRRIGERRSAERRGARPADEGNRRASDRRLPPDQRCELLASELQQVMQRSIQLSGHPHQG